MPIHAFALYDMLNKNLTLRTGMSTASSDDTLDNDRTALRTRLVFSSIDLKLMLEHPHFTLSVNIGLDG